MNLSRAGRAGFSSIEMGICFLTIAAMTATIIQANHRASLRAYASNCGSNLRQIGLATQMYCVDNGGRGPVASARAALEPYTKNDQVFSCRVAAGRGLSEADDRAGAYLIRLGLWNDDPPQTVIVEDPAPDLHPSRTWQGVRLDGAVRRWPAKLWQPLGKEGVGR